MSALVPARILPWWDLATGVEVRVGGSGALPAATGLAKTVTETEWKSLFHLTDPARAFSYNPVWADSTGWLFIFLGQPVSISHMHYVANSFGKFTQGFAQVFTSADATTFDTGTWVDRGTVPWRGDNSHLLNAGPDPVSGASDIRAIALRHQKVEFNADTTYDVRSLYIYGERSQPSNRLEFWLPDGSAQVPADHFDLGNVAQGTTVTRQFKVKNTSVTLQANQVYLRQDERTNGFIGGYLTQAPGAGSPESGMLGNLGPGALSVLVTLTRSPIATDPLAPNTWSIIASCDSWTAQS